MKTVQLILAPADASDEWRSVTLPAGAAGPSRILLMPGALVLAREIAAVGRTEMQARAAALATLAPDLAAPTDGLVCVLGPVRSGRRMAYVVSRDILDRQIAGARSHGFLPDAVAPDYAILPEPKPGEAIVAQRGDWLVRTEKASLACEADMLPDLLNGAAANEMGFDGALEAFARERLSDLPNLMQQAATKREAARSPVLAAAAMAAALIVAAILPWIDAARLNSATADLHRQAEDLARKALPAARRIVNPLAQLREAALPLARAQAGLSHAATVMEGLSRSPGVAIVRLELEAETVKAQVGVPSTALLQPLRDHVATNRLQLVETPGLSEPNSIPVELLVMAERTR